MANIFFGNLTLEQFEKRTSVKLTDEHKQILKENTSHKADLSEGNIHIFDAPFCIHCKEEFVPKLQEILNNYNFDESPLFRIMVV